MYCPICGEISIRKAEPNAPVKDYVCEHCQSQYELKSKKEYSDRYITKVNDGVYRTMINRITSLDNPSFFFMHYDNYEVNNLIIVPKCFFVPDVIEKRKPLADNAHETSKREQTDDRCVAFAGYCTMGEKVWESILEKDASPMLFETDTSGYDLPF